MPATPNQPANPELWDLVRRSTKDAITKIKHYEHDLEKGPLRSNAQATVARYGYKALFADPWLAGRGPLYDAVDLDGLPELVAAVEEIPTIMSKFGSEDSSNNGPTAWSYLKHYFIAMIPLVLAHRYTMRPHTEINDDVLKRLYIPQESYLLGTELRADVIVPLLGAKLEKDYRFKECSLVKATADMRSIFRTAQDVNPMDASTLSSFDCAMVIYNTAVDVHGHGFYFAAGPREEGYDLTERFFDGLNIAAPLSSWYIQLAVKPRGWIGYFERPHGSIFSFVFRKHISRIVNRRNFHHRMTDSEVFSAYEYGDRLSSCHPSIRVAAHRFMLSFDRHPDDDDMIVDMCIGLEAILGAGFGETVHRICTRAAAMMVKAGWRDSRSLYRAMRDIYSYRSKVVHGVRGPYKEAELHMGGEMVHSARFGTAALSSLLKLALRLENFNPDKIDDEFIFPALDNARTPQS